MNHFVKLVHYEVHRFRLIMAALMLLTALFQLGSLLIALFVQVGERREELLRFNGTGTLDVDFSFVEAIRELQEWFIFPIFISIATIGIYIFFIWYRDWIGRDTFIYRLLMLPAARGSLYLSKLAAILIFVFSMLAFQLLLVLVEWKAYHIIVPAEMQDPSFFADAFQANQAWEILLPQNFDEFMFAYGLGTIGVIVLFTAVLIERSYRGVGILYGMAYVALSFIAVVWPLATLGLGSFGASLYPEEIAVVELAMCAFVAAFSIGLGIRLLNQKITV